MRSAPVSSRTVSTCLYLEDSIKVSEMQKSNTFVPVALIIRALVSRGLQEIQTMEEILEFDKEKGKTRN